ncbi:MAG: DUF4837 family protein [Salibacteraceae bacterium]
MMRLSFLGLVLVLLLNACGDASRKDILPPNTGSKGEVLVVAPSIVWSTAYSDIINQYMNKIMYGLPQEELLLKRLEVKEDGFADMFKTHRNVLKIEVNPSESSSVKVKHNVYARQQLFVVIQLRSLEDLEQVAKDRMDQILDLFHNAEIDRLLDRNKDFGEPELNKEISEHTGLNIIMQNDYQVAVKDSGFMWLRLDQSKPLGGYQHAISQGIMIYSRLYKDTLNFSDTSIYNWKNRINQQFVSGPQNSYMSISDRFLLPKSQRITFLDQTAVEVRGLWRMEGYFMGGPFYSLVFYNPENKLQYMVEGYAYAPQFDKAPLIRQIEAIAKSAKPITYEETN